MEDTQIYWRILQNRLDISYKNSKIKKMLEECGMAPEPTCLPIPSAQFLPLSFPSCQKVHFRK